MSYDKVDGVPAMDPPEVDVASTVVEAVQTMVSFMEADRPRLDELRDYLAGRHRMPYAPKESYTEYKALAERSITNMIPLVIDNLAQMLYVEGYVRGDSDPEDSGEVLDKSSRDPAMLAWQANQMDRRQNPMFRAALNDGVQYTAVLPPGWTTPGVSPSIDHDSPVIRTRSARDMTALYMDPANDQWPQYAMEIMDPATYSVDFWVYDAEYVHGVVRTKTVDAFGTSKPRYEVVWSVPHGAPVCPVIRMTRRLDLEGSYEGETARIITTNDRLNQSVMDRLLVQSFGSWKVKTVSGMELSPDKKKAYEEKLRLSPERLLVSSDPDTKFGSLPETQVYGFLRSIQTDQETLAALGAIPPHYLTGSLNNLGAEAIAEARASLEAKVVEIKHEFGEAIEQILRLCLYYSGDMAGWQDHSSEVIWLDAQNRSLSSVADALIKLATLGIDPRLLWEMIPGMTDAKLKRWREAYDVQRVRSLEDETLADDEIELMEPVSDEVPLE